MLVDIVLGTLFVIGLLVAYLVSIRVPAGFNEPWKLRVFIAPRRFMKLVVVPALRTVWGHKSWITVWRRLMNLFKIQPPQGIKTEDLIFDGVPVRLFVPKVGGNSSAGIIYMHGGGWTCGSVDLYSELCGWLSLHTSMTVVSISYRRAPEHPYPAAFQDCEVATRHFLENAHKFGVDPSRVAVMGDSAGGNLAAALALRLRDNKVSPALKMQVLINPALQAIDLRLPSYIKDSCPVLSSELMASFWLLYALGDDEAKNQLQANNHTPAHIKRKYADVIETTDLPKDITEGHSDTMIHDGDHDLWDRLGRIFEDPHFAPGVARDLRNLPRTFVITNGNDPLRDEGIIYAKRLQKAGNQVKHVHYPNTIHGTICYARFKNCHSVREETARYIVENL